jgi:hypothetical protein
VLLAGAMVAATRDAIGAAAEAEQPGLDRQGRGDEQSAHLKATWIFIVRSAKR